VLLSKKYGAEHLVQVILFKHEMQLVILLENIKLHNTHLLFALSVHTDGSFFLKKILLDYNIIRLLYNLYQLYNHSCNFYLQYLNKMRYYIKCKFKHLYIKYSLSYC